MAEQFHLGFDIDTRPLANAKTAALDAAQAIGKLGDAEQNLTQKSALATDQQKKLEDAIKKTQQAAGQGQGAQQFADGIGKMTSAMGAASNAAASMSGALGGGGGGGGLGSALETATGGFGRMVSTLGPTGLMLGAVGVAVGVVGKQAFDAASGLAKFGDDAALMEARLKNALGSTYAARDAMQSLYKSTQETGTGFNAAADSFLRLARNSEALGATRSEIQVLSETVQKLGLISGAGRGEIQSGMIQLSQALASGRLNGDELRSIMENMPALAKAIADGLGKSVGEMRAMGAAGELTGSKVFAAILQQSDKVNQEFKTLPNTAEREFQKVGDAWSLLLADIAKKTNSSGFVQGIARGVKNSIDAARGAMDAPGGIGAGLIGNLGPGYRIATTLAQAQIAQREAADPAEQQRRLNEAKAALRTMERDTAQEAMIKENKPILDASSIAKDLDDRASKVTTLTANIKSLEAGITALQAKPTLTEADTKQLDQFNRTLIIAKKQLDDTRTPVAGLADDFGKLTAAIAQGGGGGATALIQQAQKLAESMRSQGGGGGGALGILINQEVTKGGDQIRTLGIQVKQQEALAAAVGGTREQSRELEISNDLLLKRFQMFGDLKSPVIDGFFGKLTIAMREQKVAADAAAVAQANYANSLDSAISKAQGGAAGNSGLQRSIAAEMRAREADRLRPGTYNSEMGKFNDAEGLSAQNQIAGIRQNTELQRLLAGSNGTDRDRQLAQLEFNIGASQRNLTPEALKQYGGRLASEMRGQDSAQFDADRANEVRGLQRQIGSGNRRAGLIGLSPEEMRVQTAILEKQLQLEQSGLRAGQEQYDTQIALTEQLARQNVELDKRRSSAESIRDLERQIGADQRRADLIGLPPQELRVQSAILEKRLQLEQQGLQAGQANYETQIALTEQLARQNVAYDNQRALVDSIYGSVDNVASGMKSSFVDAFEQSFQNGENAAEAFFKSFGDMARRAAMEMTYEIAVKPLVTLAANAVKMGLSNYFFGGQMTAQTSTLTGGTGNAAGVSYQAANGAAFNSGGIQAFANGGTFTNGLYDTPTLFKFANGGALGVMGEAGPEAVMPLRRGPDGRLGVSGGGGGGGDVQIIVNDMRSGKDSAPVEATSTQGPGGMRQIQILVRDEIRRSMSAGEFDRTMQANFGSTRQIARK
jgi:lambda family phage tail tape measure protein